MLLITVGDPLAVLQHLARLWPLPVSTPFGIQSVSFLSASFESFGLLSNTYHI